MRYGSDHKQETRRKILDIAGRRIRREGVEAVGVASLMADCGLTHGGFYAHFKSKDELVSAAIETAISEAGDRIFEVADQAQDGIDAFIRAYLSPEHRDSPELGCSFAALSPELSRQEGQARATASGRLEPYLDRIGRLLPATDPISVRRQATALFSLLMGSLQLARLTDDRTLSDSILEGGIKAALDLVSVLEGV
jgi:AcrR family transcriptional regulator